MNTSLFFTAARAQPAVAAHLAGGGARRSASHQLGSPRGMAVRFPSRRCLRNATRCEATEKKYGEGASTFKEAADFLQSIGFKSNTEIALVYDIATNPKSIFSQKVGAGSKKNAKVNIEARPLNVEEDMKPVCDFFLTRGVPEESLPRLVAGHPVCLAYSIESRLAPLFDYLEEIGVQDVGKAVTNRPSLLGLRVGDEGAGSLRRMVEYLKDTGYSDEDVCVYVTTTL